MYSGKDEVREGWCIRERIRLGRGWGEAGERLGSGWGEAGWNLATNLAESLVPKL